MSPFPLTTIEIYRYYQNKYKFKGVSSRNKPPKLMKDGAYAVHLDKHKSTETHRIALYENHNTTTKTDSFRAERIPEQVKTFIGNKNTVENIFRMQTYDSVMRFCNGCILWILFMNFRHAILKRMKRLLIVFWNKI